MTAYSIIKNEQFNSNEIYFNAFPTEEERNNLKALSFRWNKAKKCWYGFATIEQIMNALNNILEPVKPFEAKEIKAEKVNKYGVKVGDLFVASWGYEQTNLNYYQVTKIVGSEYVIISEVVPHIIETKNYTGMSQDVTIANPNGELLPKASRSLIKDNETGIKRKIKCYSTKENPDLWVDVDSCISARLQRGDATYYESWYY